MDTDRVELTEAVSVPLYINSTEAIGIVPDGSIRKFSADGDHADYEALRVEESRTVFFRRWVMAAHELA